MTLLLHSSMCSDTGTEYGMGGRAWLLGLSDRSVHEDTTGDAGSSLTGMGVAKGAGMHCALDRSAEEDENSNGDKEIYMGKRWESEQSRHVHGLPAFHTWSNINQRFQPIGGHLKEKRKDNRHD